MANVVKYEQANKVNSEVEALFSVVGPILKGVLFSLKRDLALSVGGYEKITLEQLARLYKEGDGDCGICFEYAVHDAIVKNNPMVLDHIDTALSRFCRIKNGTPSSILFGAEKEGALQIINSTYSLLTDDSTLATGSVGKPIKLKKHIQGVVNAFRKPSERQKLPNSINGLWKADLFVGKPEEDRWVGTTVKINKSQLESAKGLRLAIVPSRQGKSDAIEYSETKNLVICPMPYDQSFVEIFYQAWYDVKQFFNADATVPTEKWIPHGDDRFVCKQLEQRRKFPVLDIIEVLDVMKQPGLLETSNETATVETTDGTPAKINTIITPFSLMEF